MPFKANEQRVLTAMIIDDDAMQRRIVCALLADCGVTRTIEAGDGTEALSRLREQNLCTDLVLVDLNMGGMDGIEFLSQLGSERPGTAVLLLSAMDQALITAVESMAHNSGLRVLGALRKPLDRVHLQSIVRAIHDEPAERASVEAPPLMTPEDIRIGLNEHQFVPYFQPKIDMKHGTLLGAEALVRWKHPELGLVAPGRFIPVMESHGLISELTWTMLDASMATLAAWRPHGLDLSMSVNITVSFLEEIAVTENIVTIAERHAIPAPNLMLELTESMATTDLLTVIGNLARLRMRGFGLSIDDFGTGYASMQQLSRIPFSELKVDRSFVSGAQRHPHLRAILESSVHLGKRLGLVTTAEGVETAEDWHLVHSFGCDVAQGFLIARPMDAGSFLSWASDWDRYGREALAESLRIEETT